MHFHVVDVDSAPAEHADLLRREYDLAAVKNADARLARVARGDAAALIPAYGLLMRPRGARRPVPSPDVFKPPGDLCARVAEVERVAVAERLRNAVGAA